MDQKPDLRDLQRYVMPHIESDWESLCIELNFDKNGEVLDAIKKEWGSNSKASCREVLKHWVKGEGEGPHTWGKMVDCLKMIRASGAVNAIKEYLSGVSTSVESSGTKLLPSLPVDMQCGIAMPEDSAEVCKIITPEQSPFVSEDIQHSINDTRDDLPKTSDIVQPQSLRSIGGNMDSNICQVERADSDSNPAFPQQGNAGFEPIIQMLPLPTQHISYNVVKFEPRKYQLELAKPGMEGKNCIMCAPTGTGKTLVAALVIANHLSQRQGKKVVFVVPTQPLAKQQQKSLKDYIPSARVACCIGDDTGRSVRMAILNNEVVVCTAGKLWDELREMNDRSLKFTHFSLMVIDECHNTRKSSPQANVMIKYLKEKLKEGNISLPQVLGLTASPGAGDSRVPHLDSTYDHLISLCALMDATEGIVNVKKNRQELEQHTKKLTSTLKHYAGRDTSEMFIQEVLKEVKMWEADIELSTPFKPWEQRYETVIQKNKKDLENSQVPMREKFSILEYLLCLADVLTTYMKLRHEDAIRILNDFVMHCSSDTGTEHKIVASLDTLKKTLSTLEPVPNPLLEQVKEEITVRFNQSPDSRAIVFASTKKQASCICDWLSTHLHLRPRVVVGHSDETGPGMTDSEKEEALAGFREGKYNILVATSVLEEGIDVPACNLVIRYEHVTNEIAKVQAEGRARAENSEGITIVSNASNKMFKEMLNEEKDQIVKEAMEYLPTGDELLKKINEKQLLIMNKHEMKTWLDEESKNSDPKHNREKVILKCKKCKEEACHGSDLYTLQQGGYDVSVWNKAFMEQKAIKKPHPRPRDGKEGFSAAKDKIHCKFCDADWGVVGIWNESEFPILKCKSFNCEIQGIPVLLSKWSAAPFKIPPIITHPDFQNGLMTDDNE